MHLAGSLLDFALAEHAFSMPVGRISYGHLEPMTFIEFLAACGEQRLESAIRACTIAGAFGPEGRVRGTDGVVLRNCLGQRAL